MLVCSVQILDAATSVYSSTHDIFYFLKTNNHITVYKPSVNIVEDNISDKKGQDWTVNFIMSKIALPYVPSKTHSNEALYRGNNLDNEREEDNVFGDLE